MLREKQESTMFHSEKTEKANIWEVFLESEHGNKFVVRTGFYTIIVTMFRRKKWE